MDSALIANVGNSDVALNIATQGDPYYCAATKQQDGVDLRETLGCGEGARAIAERLLGDLDAYCERLMLPILAPALDLVLEEEDPLDLLVLVGTDQAETAGEHRLWDTISAAHLIREYLRRTRSETIDEIKVVACTASPPGADAYTFFSDLIDEHMPPTDFRRVYASMNGGIPAMNAALVAQTVHAYGPSAIALAVAEPTEEHRVAGRLGLATRKDTWPTRKQALLRVLRALLERSDYTGALEFLHAEQIDTPTARAFLEHAAARQNFNFNRAVHALDGFETGTAGQWRASASSERDNSVQRLTDVAASASDLLARGDYVSFVTRAATLCEICRRLLARRLIGFELGDRHLTLDAVVDNDKNLKPFLDHRLPRGGERRWPVDKKLLDALVEWGKKKHPDVERHISGVRDRLGDLSGIETLRNETLHLLRGLGKSDIDAALVSSGSTFRAIADEMLAAMRVIERRTEGTRTNPVEDVYEGVAQAVLTEISAR
jgi:hypothetical protein